MESINAIVIGAGVVGLALGRALSQHMQVGVLEQENHIGTGISSRNSGVIHAGIYYPNTFLKSKLCIQGRQMLYHYCQDHAIAHQRCGKLILATSDEEIVRLKKLQLTAANNGVTLGWLTQTQVAEYEPEVYAKAALFSAESGIVDSAGLMLQLQADIEKHGSVVSCQQHVSAIKKVDTGFIVEINHRDHIHCQILINAAGLNAQHIAKLLDSPNIPPLYLCKGQYFSFQGKAPFKHLVYPLPLANNQGLGVHATLDLAGRVRFGPDANYLSAENYQNDDSARTLFATAIARYFPAVDAKKLQADYCGIRPKLSAEGEAMQDFVIQDETCHGMKGLIHLFGIESPGLTASLALAEMVNERLRA